jgi:hypothetical protein
MPKEGKVMSLSRINWRLLWMIALGAALIVSLFLAGAPMITG